ncbi:MAG TPA: hypothetical protein DDZ76_00030 [Xanthomonadales bacterium]|nr:hypothetical protein [Xanthomonadales bacterium]
MNTIELTREESAALARQTAGIVELDDQALASIAGGCTSTCGGGFLTTSLTSCVPPGTQCP